MRNCLSWSDLFKDFKLQAAQRQYTEVGQCHSNFPRTNPSFDVRQGIWGALLKDGWQQRDQLADLVTYAMLL